MPFSDAIKGSDQIGIPKFVLRSKQRLAAIELANRTPHPAAQSLIAMRTSAKLTLKRDNPGVLVVMRRAGDDVVAVEAVMKRIERAIAVQQSGDRDTARQQFAELWERSVLTVIRSPLQTGPSHGRRVA